MLKRLMYPDVLGKITDQRIRLDRLHFAVGLLPKAAFLNQSFTLVVVFQSTVAQNMRVRVQIQLPTAETVGRPVSVQSGKTSMSLGLRPGEVGVLRVPLMPVQPTRPAKDYPIQIAVRYRTSEETTDVVRMAFGGVRPAALSISPYKIKTLQDVNYNSFKWYQSAESVTTHFDVLDRLMPPIIDPPNPSYETLWSSDEMREENALVTEVLDDAVAIAQTFDLDRLHPVLMEAARESMMPYGVTLHEGEAWMLGGLLIHILSLPSHQLPEMHWFATLAQWLAHHRQPTTARVLDDLVKSVLIAPMLVDAERITRMALIDSALIHDSPSEYSSFARHHALTSLSDWYSPLIVGALLLDVLPKSMYRQAILDQLRAARDQREALATSEDRDVLRLFDDLWAVAYAG